MSEQPPETTCRISDGGIAADHPAGEPYCVLAGTSTGQEFNTLRPMRSPIACWRLEDTRFEFDSSFISPPAAEEFKNLASLKQAHPKSPATIFGHADPTGDDEYNKTLSGRRAMAVYGMLTRRTDIWEELYSNPLGGDDWGVRSVQTLLLDLGYPPGEIDGKMGSVTSGALKNFQAKNGLPPTGANDKATRAKLFLAYMDKHCRTPSGEKFQLTADDFLARMQDPKGKGDYQGCGEFNPLLVFSQEESKEYAKPANKPERDADNAPNRRVLVFLFQPGSRFDPGLWPCPRAAEGAAGCRKRFWLDADKRRGCQPQRREYQDTHDTFACRFYDRQAVRSPCERVLKVYRIRLLDLFARPIPNAPYQISANGRQSAGQADGQGWAFVRATDVPSEAQVSWGLRPLSPDSPPQLVYQATMHLLVDGPEKPAAFKRLENLGYRAGKTLEQKIRAFQRAYGVEETGRLEDVKDKLWGYHDSAEPEPLPENNTEET